MTMNLGAARLGYRWVFCKEPINTSRPTIFNNTSTIAYSTISQDPAYVPNGSVGVTLVGTSGSYPNDFVEVPLPFTIFFYHTSVPYALAYSDVIYVSQQGYIFFNLNLREDGPHIRYFSNGVSTSTPLTVSTRTIGGRFIIYMTGPFTAEFSFYENLAYGHFYSTLPVLPNDLATGVRWGQYVIAEPIVADTAYLITFNGSLYHTSDETPGTYDIVTPNLIAYNGSWYLDHPVTSVEYQWYSSNIPILGATSQSYLIPTDNVSLMSGPILQLKVFVTLINQCGSGSATTINHYYGYPVQFLSTPTLNIIQTGPNPVNVGDTLYVTNQDYIGSTPRSFVYEWRRNDTIITGANTDTYVITNEDIGQAITVKLTISNMINTVFIVLSLGRPVFKTNKVLIVYDLNSYHPGHYDSDVHPSLLATNISTYETSLGMIPIVAPSYAALEAYTDEQLAEFAHMWDVGYDTLITAGAASRYDYYLSTNGAIFLLGENGSFVQRDQSIDSFIGEQGGGTLVPSSYRTDIVNADLNPRYLLVNTNPQVRFNAAGIFVERGTGDYLAYNSDQTEVYALVWGIGSLIHQGSAIVSVLDVNFLDSNNLQPDFIENLVAILNTQ